MDIRQAMSLVKRKYLADKAEEKQRKKEHKTKGGIEFINGAKVARCPKCRSVSIHYQESAKGQRYIVCMNCGNEWKL